jgi:RNA polymerase sigma-70 factor (ECF subfamily)
MNEEQLLDLLSANHRPLLRYLYGTVRDHHLAEELTQETMLRAWRYRDSLVDDEAPTRAWLYRVAHNVAIDHLRRRRVLVVDPSTTEVSTVDPLDGLASRLDLRAALARLSTEQRSVLVEVYYRGATTMEAARALRIPHGTAKSRLFCGLRRLRSTLAA